MFPDADDESDEPSPVEFSSASSATSLTPTPAPDDDADDPDDDVIEDAVSYTTVYSSSDDVKDTSDGNDDDDGPEDDDEDIFAQKNESCGDIVTATAISSDGGRVPGHGGVYSLFRVRVTVTVGTGSVAGSTRCVDLNHVVGVADKGRLAA